MTDRELLELAAKAAGYDVAWNEHWHCLQHKNPKPDRLGNLRFPWIPLDDDGDALRLAVRLGILLRTDFIKLLSGLMKEGMEHGQATRRAIVQTAAEIGKLK